MMENIHEAKMLQSWVFSVTLVSWQLLHRNCSALHAINCTWNHGIRWFPVRALSGSMRRRQCNNARRPSKFGHDDVDILSMTPSGRHAKPTYLSTRIYAWNIYDDKPSYVAKKSSTVGYITDETVSGVMSVQSECDDDTGRHSKICGSNLAGTIAKIQSKQLSVTIVLFLFLFLFLTKPRCIICTRNYYVSHVSFTTQSTYAKAKQYCSLTRLGD